MTYIFYETGDDAFFSRISRDFSSSFTNYIKNNIYHQVLRPGNTVIEGNLKEILQEVLVNHTVVLTLLNCFLFPAVHANCQKNIQCKNDHNTKDDHKVVLASDQLEIFEDSMAESKANLASDKVNIKDSRVRNNMQRILESCKTIRNDEKNEYFEHIEIASKAHPRDYKRKNLSRYMKSYIKKANDMGNGAGPKDFVYVRTKNAGSHFNQFQKNIKSPNVTVMPCDEF